MNSTFDPLVGQVLDGRYEIVAKVARGGMATVYRARDRRLSRAVAVKVMRADLGEDDEYAAKFDREARSAAVLSHPAVVGIFDQGTSQGQPYIVMEFIEGETLRRVISREAPLEPERALEIFEQIASALACAHEAGVVHRDIKPENVMLTRRGQVKVADFGLARQVGSPQMTATGVLVGTASYLPPELVTHARPDGRSDVYSAGIVLYEMLTGKKPHTGENNYQIAYRHVNVDIGPPSAALTQLGHTGPPVPDYLDALVLAATRRDPQTRISDGRELLSATRRARLEFTRSGGADNPSLAAALSPDESADVTKTEAVLRTGQRPRPSTAGYTPAPSSSPTWEPPEEDEEAAIVTTVSTPPTSPIPSPVPGPRSQRTPVFPNLHISQDPVHRRRRGIIALLLVLLLTIGAALGSWWWLSGRYTSVPAMSTLNETKAREAAKANDLTVTTVDEHSESVSRGQVIRTEPGAGERVLRGTSITLVMSLGPERYPMPAVVGLQREAAEKALKDAHFEVGKVSEEYSEDTEAGEVMKASEDEGAQLAPGTKVDLTVSKGREPIRIPDHTGGDADTAKSELEDLGFNVNVTEESSSDVESGKVIRQDPKNGTGNRGDTITLVKSTGPAMVTIPGVRMMSQQEAQSKLEELDLKVVVESASNFPMRLNVVQGTNPPEGTEVPVGSTVTLYVA